MAGFMNLVPSSLALLLGAGIALAEPATFPTPEAATDAFVAALQAHDRAALLVIFGPESEDLLSSGDADRDAAARDAFLADYDLSKEIVPSGDDRADLQIGSTQWTFPVALVKSDTGWSFDVAGSRDEILARRIGENELAAIEVVRAYVDAQREYAESEHDGNGLQFARRLLSREGRKDGLYWPATDDGEPSPFGPLVAKAQGEGYRRTAGQDEPPAYHGYQYRILYAQGPNAAGGARDYILNDRMIGGFALIATPANYGNSGVMTFIVNQDGNVFEQDLGPETKQVAGRIRSFDPGPDWRKVESQ